MLIRKFVFILIILLLFAVQIFAKSVSMETAEMVALNWMYVQSDYTLSELSVNDRFIEKKQELPVYYIFNMNPGGYVIVSADNSVYPIPGFSKTGEYSLENQSPAFHSWMQNIKRQIYSAIQMSQKPIEEVTHLWEQYTKTAHSLKKKISTTTVDPLLSSTWGQGTYYNSWCPDDNYGPNNHVVTGCVATAMGQIMRYYKYPTRGSGSHSYVPPNTQYGTQYVNFGATTYNWSEMPDYLNQYSSSSEIDAVAELLYHCGVSVDMNYSPNNSTAPLQKAMNAFYNYFNYDRNIIYALRKDNTYAVWESALIQDLDAGRPVLYAGYDREPAPNVQYSGHAFVCDGYDYYYDSGYQYTYFHINWGWYGNADGWFLIYDLTLNNNDNYNFAQEAIFKIEPVESTGDGPDIDITSIWWDDASELVMGEPFDFNVSFENIGDETANDIDIIYEGYHNGEWIEIGNDTHSSLAPGDSRNEYENSAVWNYSSGSVRFRARIPAVSGESNTSNNILEETWTVTGGGSTDDNDTPETATAIDVPHTGSYAIDPENDIDWYKFYASSGTELTMYTELIGSSEIDPKFYFYGPHSSSGNDVNPSDAITSNDDGPIDYQPKIDFSISESGYYFLRVAHYSNSPTGQPEGLGKGKAISANTGAYELHVETGSSSEDGPDIDITSIWWDDASELVMGEPFDFNVSFENIGDETANDIDIIYEGYHNGEWIEIGNDTHSSLAPGDSRNEYENSAVWNYSSGSVRFRARIPAVSGESNTSNNILEETWTVTGGGSTDDNDTPETATAINIPHTGSYAIDPENDIDWYKFYASSGTELTMYTELIGSSEIDPKFYFYGPHSSSGNDVNPSDAITSNDDGPIDYQPKIEFSISESGYYFLRVAHYSNSPTGQPEGLGKGKAISANTGAYELHVETGSSSEDGPDLMVFDIWPDPDPVTKGQSFDFYYLYENGGTETAHNFDIILEGYHNGWQQLAQEKISSQIADAGDVEGHLSCVWNYSSGNVKFRVRIANVDNDTDPDNNIYEETWTVNDGGASDNNDIPGSATAINIPHTGSYAIDPENDIDWYKFYASSGTELTMYTELIGSSEIDPKFYFYGPHSSNGSDVNPSDEIASNDDGPIDYQPKIDFSISESGYHFLRVAHYSNSPTGQPEGLGKGMAISANTGAYELHVETESSSGDGPDIDITSIWWDDASELVMGEPFDFNVSFENIGDETANDIDIIYEGYHNDEWIEIGNDTHSSLAPGDSRNEYENSAVWNYSSGSVRFRARIPAVSGESNTSNNILEETWTVTGGGSTDDNDTPETATAIDVPHTGSYAIDPENDIDWYKFYASSGTELTMYTELIGSSEIDPKFYFYGPHSSNGSDVNPSDEIASNDDGHVGAQPKIEFSISESGYYFLRVAHWSNRPEGLPEGLGKGKAISANTGAYELIIDHNVDVAETEVPLPTHISLYQNYPNPFNPITTIQFSLSETGPVQLGIFSTNGTHIKTLVHSELSTGYYTYAWDGKDSDNHLVPSGIYIYRLQTINFTQCKKMTFLK